MRLLLSLAAVLALSATAARAAATVSGDDAVRAADPLVLLDAAKITLASGKLNRAREQFEAIELGQAEPQVDQEIIFQQMLLAAAFMDSCHYLREAYLAHAVEPSDYLQWLGSEQQREAQRYAGLAREYWRITDDGGPLQFVRFRLPPVSKEHVEDTALYLSREMLDTARTNWLEGREALGRGLILSQARVALLLSAAGNYDLARASEGLAGLESRLTAGVPLDERATLDWIAETALRSSAVSPEARLLGGEAEARLSALLAAEPSALLSGRQRQRAGGGKTAAEPAAPAETTGAEPR